MYPDAPWGSVSKLRVCALDHEAGLRFLRNVLRLSWTPYPGGTMMCGNLEFGRRNGHRGLAAEPWPRTV
jgi:hypothetical protein